MKKRLQMVLIHSAAGIVLFLAALIFFNVRMMPDRRNSVAELPGSTYPVMEIVAGEQSYNLMKGYRGKIDLSLVRNQISLPDASGDLAIRLHCYDYDITAVQYALFEDDPDQPVEEGTINKLSSSEGEGIRTGTIHFTTDLKEGKTYFLRMAARLDNHTRIWFYTRLANGLSEYEEYLRFAGDFHYMLLDKENSQSKAAVYLEPEVRTASDSLEHVDIHSSMHLVTYGDMAVKEEQMPRLHIREINATYAVVELTTVLSSEIRENVVQYYDVSETFKMRFSPERMFLLDYQREMNARYNPRFIDPANNDIGLGIQNALNIDYISSKDGYKVTFTDQGQLWYYDYKSSNAARIYSFTTENVADLRNDQDEHGIHLLKMDEHGTITYLVYGYISRGTHEGANGIQILRYHPENNYSEEMAFLTTSVSYDSLKEDLERLAYLNQNNIFYCLLDGDLHEIDLNSHEDKILRSGFVNESLTASGDQSLIAIEKDNDGKLNTEIEIRSLETGDSRTVSCEETERIRAVGFLNQNFIYAVGEADHITRDESGALSFPADELTIIDMNGNEVRKYQKANRYIIETDIRGSVLDMRFARKNGNRFERTEDKDYIRYKEENAVSVTLTTKHTAVFGEQLYFSFPDYVYIQTEPDLILTKFRVSNEDHTLNLKRSNDKKDQYYVFADGQKRETYTNLPDAVNKASELRGNVMTNSEKIIWECAFEPYSMVAGMDQVIKVKSDRLSLAGSLSMIAALNGRTMTPDEIDRKPGMPAALLEMCTGCSSLTLTGCSLDDVLYYISKGSPVLAKYSDSKYVVIMSYNSTKIRYLDPVTGKSTVENRTSITETLKKQGNLFYSYL